MSSSSMGALPFPIVLQIIISRTLIGFAIGISCLNMGSWAINGLIMGLIFSLPLSFSGMMAQGIAANEKALTLFWTIILGMIYGLLIELVTSVIFGAKLEARKK